MCLAEGCFLFSCASCREAVATAAASEDPLGGRRPSHRTMLLPAGCGSPLNEETSGGVPVAAPAWRVTPNGLASRHSDDVIPCSSWVLGDRAAIGIFCSGSHRPLQSSGGWGWSHLEGSFTSISGGGAGCWLDGWLENLQVASPCGLGFLPAWRRRWERAVFRNTRWALSHQHRSPWKSQR